MGTFVGGTPDQASCVAVAIDAPRRSVRMAQT
jgi:hypothetical protein